jgi:dATP pyrophosphohydrolase
MTLDIREEIPIRSFSISAYVVGVEGGRGKYLILRRVSRYLHASWQQVSGRIEPGELGWQAALREIREETGLVPARFYSVDQTEIFYEHRQNCINIVPVFAGFVEGTPQVELSPSEHDEFRWITVAEARKFLPFSAQLASIEWIEARFVREQASDFLRIEL